MREKSICGREEGAVDLAAVEVKVARRMVSAAKLLV